MPNINLKDKDGNIVTYNGINKIQIQNASGGNALFVNASGAITITKNGSYDVTTYQNAIVNIDGSSNLTTVAVPLAIEERTIFPDGDYDGFSEIFVQGLEGSVIIVDSEGNEVEIETMEIENGIVVIKTIFSSGYNPLNEYLKGTKTKIHKEDLKGLTEIRDYAFAYSSITEVEFSDTVVKIGDRAFFQTEITSVNLTGIRTIGQYAFSYTPITEIIIPSSVTSLSQRCFENCKQLKKAIIECLKLQEYVFQHDAALEEIICLLETPPTITTSTFAGTTCPIKVRADLVDTYKSFTNWTLVADRIVAYEGD